MKLIPQIIHKEYDHPTKHPKCLGWYNEFTGDYDCDYEWHESVMSCDECAYGVGDLHPETGEIIK